MGLAPATGWEVVLFRDCVVRRRQRELLYKGAPRAIEPRAFDVLVCLIDERHCIATKDAILRHCWAEEARSDTALARTIMKIRQAIGDFDARAPLVKTFRGAGYRFVGNVQFALADDALVSAPATSAIAPKAERRLVLLPVVNETDDAALGWSELGLMSLVAKSLVSVPGITIVPVQDTLVALGGLASRDRLESKLAAVDSALGAKLCIWGQLSGTHARMLLSFSLRREDKRILEGTVIGTDPAKMAIAASIRLRHWLGAGDSDANPEWAIDLGDEFLNQVFVRALQCSREERLIEADHLLDVLRYSGVNHPSVLLESARVLVSLGKPQALAELQALDAAAHQTGDPFLQSTGHALRGSYLEREGALAEAVSATLEAVGLAEQHGLSDLAVRLMVACAGRMAMASDRRAEIMLSRAIPGAERLGNRVLLCDAYCAAARVAGFRNDWLTALRHQDAAVAIARTMHEAARSWAYGGLSWIQTALGQLSEAAASASIAFATARLSGAQPQQGLAAGQAALAYMANGDIRETAALYKSLQALSNDTSVAMRVARDVYCRAGFLSVTGHVDESLRIIGDVCEAAARHPRLLSRCRGERIRVLLQSRRFDELGRFIDSLNSAQRGGDDERLSPLIEWALAFREYLALGKVDVALERLHRLIRTHAASEAFARASLDVAWIHLERGQADVAARSVASVQSWLEQSQPGMLVAARLRFALGDMGGAVAIQQTCLHRFRETATDFQRELLENYRQAERGVRIKSLPVIDEPINLQWRISDVVRKELPAELGVAPST